MTSRSRQDTKPKANASPALHTLSVGPHVKRLRATKARLAYHTRQRDRLSLEHASTLHRIADTENTKIATEMLRSAAAHDAFEAARQAFNARHRVVVRVDDVPRWRECMRRAAYMCDGLGPRNRVKLVGKLTGKGNETDRERTKNEARAEEKEEATSIEEAFAALGPGARADLGDVLFAHAQWRVVCMEVDTWCGIYRYLRERDEARARRRFARIRWGRARMKMRAVFALKQVKGNVSEKVGKRKSGLRSEYAKEEGKGHTDERGETST